MILENLIQTKKTGRYYTLGKVSNTINKIWFVFHGYGQLANEFIENFDVLKNEDTLIISIEALNKFYLRGFSGKIGASWMTKEDRENEINDYTGFIDSVYNEILEKIDISIVKFNVFGYSQGTHTAVRWLQRSRIHIDNLILWSGSLPRDCNYTEHPDYWSTIKTKIVLGTKDRFIDNTKMNEEIKHLVKLYLDLEFISFDGGHEINSDLLLKISNTF